MKLWQKNTQVNSLLEKFTLGEDPVLDVQLAPFDILGSLAHAQMLCEQGLLDTEDYAKVRQALKQLFAETEAGTFTIAAGTEDVHSEVENRLTQMCGTAGKRIHTARSRNDQVLLDLRLFLRYRIEQLCTATGNLFKNLMQQGRQQAGVLMPGYTHMQAAMPSSFGLWFGAYAESLCDDLQQVLAAYRVIDKNPLGSAAGYGSSFNISRQRTTDLLGFAAMNVNVVYAQMGRGKTERVTAFAIAAVAATLNKLAMDNCLFINENYGFITLPASYTTGSSIMPHKKNPDGWELIRGKCAALMALPGEISAVCTNLPLGYNRDMQLLKGKIMGALDMLEECLQLAAELVAVTGVKKDILADERYKFIFSVEEVNRLVMEGMAFRDAYRQLGAAIEAGSFRYNAGLEHTHEGSIGAPGFEMIEEEFARMISKFDFEKGRRALQKLLEE